MIQIYLYYQWYFKKKTPTLNEISNEEKNTNKTTTAKVTINDQNKTESEILRKRDDYVG